MDKKSEHFVTFEEFLFHLAPPPADYTGNSAGGDVESVEMNPLSVVFDWGGEAIVDMPHAPVVLEFTCMPIM